MNPVYIHYCLDEDGRHARFVLGVCAQREQVTEIKPDNDKYDRAVKLATINEDGVAYVNLTHLEWNCDPSLRQLLDAASYKPVDVDDVDILRFTL